MTFSNWVLTFCPRLGELHWPRTRVICIFVPVCGYCSDSVVDSFIVLRFPFRLYRHFVRPATISRLASLPRLALMLVEARCTLRHYQAPESPERIQILPVGSGTEDAHLRDGSSIVPD